MLDDKQHYTIHFERVGGYYDGIIKATKPHAIAVIEPLIPSVERLCGQDLQPRPSRVVENPQERLVTHATDSSIAAWPHGNSPGIVFCSLTRRPSPNTRKPQKELTTTRLALAAAVWSLRSGATPQGVWRGRAPINDKSLKVSPDRGRRSGDHLFDGTATRSLRVASTRLSEFIGL